ncbi:Uncharacterised protein [Actinobacillus pleuropneumoniae]|nr:Uncharacterised protein [Actinobacillus pleuropneumoniae]
MILRKACFASDMVILDAWNRIALMRRFDVIALKLLLNLGTGSFCLPDSRCYHHSLIPELFSSV